ncbi:uncharacterized protein Z518_07517 [Rhinocladiella mackenziei CBS 650.93]|uniref:Roadblock/LAMTOR2 domain-containing protein n=1 Tax=Rhinocladiella mackenziei CBS 650.93 TaxID=1442369 RepID=A0A0D2IDS8_9EURO|nr:uncharacterized protein Z518_07517 [Rhinocladiella mackenziei CBS 650.93]KIX03964.1 hypothetical protein Z518_07517 [Rhinocladiella mackenziei CBS 650.93]
MSQVCLLDSERLSALLREALSWSDNVSSLMVSALNGSILAYAYRDDTPSIKAMRTQSTTMTAAYTVASEDILVFEAQNMGAISVITPIADHILLAVTGPEPKQTPALRNGEAEEMEPYAVNGVDGNHEEEDDEDEDHQQIRTDLEVVSQELANVLREELALLKWPDDI